MGVGYFLCSRRLMREAFFIRRYASPLGRYALISSQGGVVCVVPEGEVGGRTMQWQRSGEQLHGTGKYNDILAGEFDAYFAGGPCQFSVPLDLRGTPFQLEVWRLICRIPYGETRSYRCLAHSLGSASFARAVGRAAGSNPVAIVVPCHRVVGVAGNLVGYAGGLHRKRALLELESAVVNKNHGTCP